ncbi:DUF6603 domain-containing protein [Kitasatospora sp. NPDC056783]|uniref:DUF6603 domain-containing protein n=1 Tax=Kitasatospora sp. NPDC056783 TaxID=3345943 RepID=UPI0036A44048
MDLDALKGHLTGLGDPPTLRADDAALPGRLRTVLAAFPDGACRGAAGSGRPDVDAGRTKLRLPLVWESAAWPAGALVAMSVKTVTVTVTAQGSVSVVLGGTFDGVEVESTLAVDDVGWLTAAVRPRQPGAFARALDELGGRFAGGDLWRTAREGLRAFGFDPGDVAGFDYRLVRTGQGASAGHQVTSVAIVADLDVKGLPLEVALRLPDLGVTGRLRDGKPVDVRSLLESFGIPAGEVPESAAVSELTFGARLGDWYLLQVKATGDWSPGPFTVTSLSLYVYQDALQGLTARIAGTATIGSSLDIEVSAAKAADDKGGWTFGGGLEPGEALRMADVLDALHLPDAPEPVKAMELTALWLSHTTGTGTLDFVCRGEVTIAQGVTATLEARIGKDDSGARYSGVLDIDGFTFDVVFDSRTSGTHVLAATYRSPGEGTGIALRDWVAHFSPALAEDVPDSLRIDLKDAKFVRVTPPGGPARFCVGVDLSADFDLTHLPLVGGFLAGAGGDLAVRNLQVLYSSDVFDKETTAVVNALLGQARVVPLPEAGLKAGVGALADLRIGKDTVPVALGVPPAGTGGAGTPGQPAAPGAPGTPSTPNTPAGPASTAVWVQVQKQLGVVQINRVGVVYQNNALLFALDAGVTLGPLSLSLDGLAVGSALDHFAPVFQLDGVGVGYTAPPVEIAGALLRIPAAQLGQDVLFQFDGTATIAVPDFSLAAIGSYAQLKDGWPSLFLFGQLEAPLGGPPPLLVTGLMAGFGFNRELTLPTAREVTGFPLLTLNKQGPDAAKRPSDVLDVLEGREPAVPGGPSHTWISPKEGSYWLALGIEFTVAEVVNAKVLLAAEFGRELALAVLGIATVQLPMPAESATRTYVYAELGLEAEVRPLAGSFELAAQLAPVSYVLTPDCHLTGGFAAALWFGPHPNAGQFVVTLGGYHPAFEKPASYPDVPRLGIDWAVSGNLTITAQAYLAVTPSCAMAGGRLSIDFHAGDFRAWFTAQADLLLSWRPFSFTARISVSIGASYTINVGIIHKTISVSVGADLELWGPPTGGSVTAHFVGFSKTIGFGPARSGTATKALGWSEFADLLPKPADVVTVGPVGGIDGAVEDTAGHDRGNSGKTWYARARDLRFFTQSAVPASHLRTGTDPLSTPRAEDGPGVDVRPMDLSGLVGEHRLTLFHEDAPAPMDGWTTTPRTHHLPAALWGAPPTPFSHTPGAPSAEVLADRPVGWDVRAPRPQLADSRGVFPLSEYSADEIPPGLAPLPSAPADRDDVFVPDDTSVRRIGQTDRGPARTGRDQVCAALVDAGLLDGPSDALSTLAAGAGHFFGQAPMVRNPDRT